MPSSPSLSLSLSELSESDAGPYDTSPGASLGNSHSHASHGLPLYVSGSQDDSEAVTAIMAGISAQPEIGIMISALPSLSAEEVTTAAVPNCVSVDGRAHNTSMSGDPVQEFAEFCASLNNQPDKSDVWGLN